MCDDIQETIVSTYIDKIEFRSVENTKFEVTEMNEYKNKHKREAEILRRKKHEYNLVRPF